METSIWVIILHQDFRPKTTSFRIEVELSKDVQSILSIAGKGQIDPACAEVWKTEGDSTLTADNIPWDALKKTNFKDSYIIKRLELFEQLKAIEFVANEVLLIRTWVGLEHPDLADEDSVSALPEFARYNKMLSAVGKSPSGGAKSNEYRKSQASDALVIYDGRRDPKKLTTAPPIQIFHPIFDDFTQKVNDPVFPLTFDDLKNVRDLMSNLCEINPAEPPYGAMLRHYLRKILGVTILEEQFDGCKPDGTVMVQAGSARVPILITELKREFGEGGCDASSQVSIAMRRIWHHESVRVVREKCCCPTFLIAAGGPWLAILGGVVTDKVIIQRLTELRWMALSSTEEDNRVYHNAKVLVVLRKCLKDLTTFYESNVKKAPPFVEDKPHPRYFPYPTSFTVNKTNTSTSFPYLKSLENHLTCVMYLVEIVNQDGTTGDKVVVKFVTKYGTDVHIFLARQKFAPTLRYHGDLRETSPSFLGPQSPPGFRLNSNIMQMVVMDWVDTQKPPKNAYEQIKKVLKLLHDRGYVFGDLRMPNVLFDKDGVKFIDFNWCGPYRDGQEKQIDEADGQVEPNYAYYPLSMSNLAGMWALGMEPLAEIRPEHDLAMLEKLFCNT